MKKKKEKIHDNASPVYKLLKQREFELGSIEPKGKKNDI
jgi:hypothetical protein